MVADVFAVRWIEGWWEESSRLTGLLKVHLLVRSEAPLQRLVIHEGCVFNLVDSRSQSAAE